MLDIKFLRDNLEEVEKRLALRGGTIDLSEFKKIDEDRRRLIAEVEGLKQKKNAASEEIARLKKEKKDAAHLLADMQQVSSRIKELDEKVKEEEDALERLLLNIPNIPHSSVPSGKISEDNVEVRKSGSLPKFSFAPRDHSEIGEMLGILDFERAGKLAGARFSLYKGAGALLERALINFMLRIHTKNWKRLLKMLKRYCKDSVCHTAL